MLKQKRDLLEGIGCSSVRDLPGASNGGTFSRLMAVRMKRVLTDDTDLRKHDTDDDNAKDDAPTRPQVDYYRLCNEADPFPDISLLDPVDFDQHSKIAKVVDKMVEDAIKNGFPPDKLPRLRNFVNKNINMFRTSFSSGPSGSFPPLQIELQRDIK